MRPSFTKHNHSAFPDALRREAEGLALLRRRLEDSPLQVPEVFHVDDSRLEMTAIDPGSWCEDSWRRLGQGLAHLHHRRESGVGLPQDNYIGLNPQPNRDAGDWGAFFLEYRLAYQVSLVREGAVRREFSSVLERKGAGLVDYLNRHCVCPSLVHGDLWSGNVLCDSGGGVWLIDPAVYRGDREVDIAMTEMFGCFDAAFYRAYEAVLPLSSEYPTKKVIYNLYHYLNHYNLFGSGYLAGCRRGFAAVAAL